MSEQVTLERSYRRILAWYPRSFRAGSEDEILAVLLATAEDGQTRVGLAEAWDLVRGAVRMRLWPAAPRPRSVRVAVKLMLAGAAAELAALITVVVTVGSVRSAVLHSHQAAAGAVMTHVVIDEVGMPLLIGIWLFLAWAISQGRDAARFGFTSFFLLITMGLIVAQAQGGAAYAPADLIAVGAEWFIALAAVVLIFVPATNRYFRQQAAPVIYPAG